MAGQKGRDVLIKLSDGSGGFLTAAGIRTTRFVCTSAGVESTNADSIDAWRELLVGAGVKTVSVQGNGVFKSAVSDSRLRSLFFDGSHDVFRLIIPGFGTLEGPFHVASLTFSGAYDGEAQFGITLESAGPISFTAIAP
ncbi:MAG: phage major tail protein, TP901-1 family [Pseudomonadota bacterium]